MRQSPRGFTLIELLLVISIIALLSSIVFSQVAVARTKSIDTAKKADMATVRSALRSFHLDHGRMPHNYSCSGASCVVNDARSTLAMEDTTSPDAPITESGKAYRASMLELVNGGYLSKVPKSPGGAGYVYYDYGPGSAAGAIVGTNLTSETPSASGAPGSCRPFEPVSVMTTVPSGGGLASPLGEWIACFFEEGGEFFERACVEGGEDGGEDAPNLCSTAVTSDYCLCSRY